MKTATLRELAVATGRTHHRVMRRHREWALVALGAGAATAVYATFSLLLHRSFHTSGWDLGIYDQVVWNMSRGRWFEYSFRDISYAGDHWQPALLLLVPAKWLWAGPEPLVIAQALGLGASVVTIYGYARALTGTRAAALVAGAWAASVGVGRAVAFDFHLDPFTPALIFGALWAAAERRTAWFAVATLGMLLLKEDMGLVTVAVSWIGWQLFGLRRSAAIVGGVGLVYSYLVMTFLIPHYRADDVSPLIERYGYLGDTPIEVVLRPFRRPDLVIEHLAEPDVMGAAALVLLSAALLPLTQLRLLPAPAIVTVPALLSASDVQSTLGQHYLVVPAALAFAAGIPALRELDTGRTWARVPRVRVETLAAGWLVVVAVLWAWKSALPPSFAAEPGGFHVGARARLQQEFVEMMPAEVAVSAQSAYVPHLSEREDIYEFPRVLDAEAVLVEPHGSLPAHSREGFDECLAALPALGFDLIRDEDGIQLWWKMRPAEVVPGVPRSCSGVDAGGPVGG